MHCLVVSSEGWCALQAQQQQSSGLEKQSMKAKGDQEGRQVTDPQAHDSRSASPCIPQQTRHVC